MTRKPSAILWPGGGDRADSGEVQEAGALASLAVPALESGTAARTTRTEEVGGEAGWCEEEEGEAAASEGEEAVDVGREPSELFSDLRAATETVCWTKLRERHVLLLLALPALFAFHELRRASSCGV